MVPPKSIRSGLNADQPGRHRIEIGRAALEELVADVGEAVLLGDHPAVFGLGESGLIRWVHMADALDVEGYVVFSQGYTA